MRRSLVLLVVVAALAALVVAAGSQASGTAPTMRNCGSFKYGLDGLRPGPGGIREHGVSCWLAKAVALLGPGPGWRCVNRTGVLYVCRPRSGSAVVKFYGK